MKDAPHQSQEQPLNLPPKPAAPAAPVPQPKHVSGSIWSLDGKLQTRGYVPGSGK
jgi:hypothetical protein